MHVRGTHVFQADSPLGPFLPCKPTSYTPADWMALDGTLFVENKKPFTAVFAQNDFIAIGAISALHEAGVRVPEDISIIGYDDIPEAEFSNPPLTTIHQPLEEIGRATTRMLVQMIEDREATPTQFLFDTELIVRSSCTCSA
jgi:alanine racemase